jgi:hypothetical protein
VALYKVKSVELTLLTYKGQSMNILIKQTPPSFMGKEKPGTAKRRLKSQEKTNLPNDKFTPSLPDRQSAPGSFTPNTQKILDEIEEEMAAKRDAAPFPPLPERPKQSDLLRPPRPVSPTSSLELSRTQAAIERTEEKIISKKNKLLGNVHSRSRERDRGEQKSNQKVRNMSPKKMQQLHELDYQLQVLKILKDLHARREQTVQNRTFNTTMEYQRFAYALNTVLDSIYPYPQNRVLQSEPPAHFPMLQTLGALQPDNPMYAHHTDIRVVYSHDRSNPDARPRVELKRSAPTQFELSVFP